MRPLFSLQGPRRREGRQPRFPEDLVAVGVADPGQIPLRPQEALQLHPGLIEHRGEGFRGERRIQRLYAQAADRRGLLNLRRPPDVQTGALLWSQLHQPEILTAVELEDQRHVLCGALRRGGDRQPPVALGVDDHDQRAGEVEEGEFPPPAHILDRRPLDGRDRRGDRLPPGEAGPGRGAGRSAAAPRPSGPPPRRSSAATSTGTSAERAKTTRPSSVASSETMPPSRISACARPRTSSLWRPVTTSVRTAGSVRPRRRRSASAARRRWRVSSARRAASRSRPPRAAPPGRSPPPPPPGPVTESARLMSANALVFQR